MAPQPIVFLILSISASHAFASCSKETASICQLCNRMSSAALAQYPPPISFTGCGDASFYSQWNYGPTYVSNLPQGVLMPSSNGYIYMLVAMCDVSSGEACVGPYCPTSMPLPPVTFNPWQTAAWAYGPAYYPLKNSCPHGASLPPLLWKISPAGQNCSSCNANCPACRQPGLAASCQFYASCLEVQAPCGPTGYALAYGEKYCNRYTDYSNQRLFTSAGLAWRDCVLVCLQQYIASSAISSSTSCANIKSMAFDSHPACYVQCGVCNLPLNDIRAIRQIICDNKLCTNQWNWDFARQAFATVVGCAQSVAQAGTLSLTAATPSPLSNSSLLSFLASLETSINAQLPGNTVFVNGIQYSFVASAPPSRRRRDTQIASNYSIFHMVFYPTTPVGNTTILTVGALALRLINSPGLVANLTGTEAPLFSVVFNTSWAPPQATTYGSTTYGSTAFPTSVSSAPTLSALPPSSTALLSSSTALGSTAPFSSSTTAPSVMSVTVLSPQTTVLPPQTAGPTSTTLDAASSPAATAGTSSIYNPFTVLLKQHRQLLY